VAAFHYLPLRTAKAGKQLGRFGVEDRYTTTESELLVRLPIWYGMNRQFVNYIAKSVIGFYS
jgi:dTDP-4-amino-4,6-dideoxygalactose transaminase